MYEVKTECFYKDLKTNLTRFDTSDYSADNFFQIPRENKKIPGFFKDEMNGQIITEFIGLRSKMYCIKAEQLSLDDSNNLKKVKGYEKTKRAKGVKQYVLRNHITFENYLDCVLNNKVISRNQNTIRSKLHHVYSITQKKITLSPFDNKRYICEDKIQTLPWGHYKIN